MARIMGVTFEIAGRVGASLNSAFASVGSKIKSLGAQTKELNAMQLKLGKLASAQTKLDTAKANYAANPTAALAKEVTRAELAFDNASRAVGRLSDAYRRHGIDTANLGRAEQQLAAEARRVESAFARQQKLQDLTTKRGELRSAGYHVMAMGATVAAPVMVAANFEASMSKVGAVSRASKEEMARLTATAEELGRTTAFSAVQASEGMQFLAMAGFKTNDIISAMPGMLDMAAAAGADLGTAADIASNVLTAFNMEAGESTHVADVLTAAFTGSNTSLQMIGETMKYVGPVAAGLSVDLETTAAMAGALGNAGIQASQAGTTLRAMMLRLVAPTTKAKDALADLVTKDMSEEEIKEYTEGIGQGKKKLEELGIQTLDAQGNMRDMPSILREMGEAFDRMNLGTGQREAIINDVFGKNAAAGATALLKAASQQVYDENGNLTTALDLMVRDIQSSDGMAKKVAAGMLDNFKGQLTLLKSAGESLAISVGKTVLPTFKSIATSIAGATAKLSQFVQAHPALTKAFMLTATGGIAAFGSLIGLGYGLSIASTGLLHLGGFVTKVLPILSALRGALSTASIAQWALNGAMLANPIGLVIAAIAAVIGGIVLLYKKSESFRDLCTVVWETIKSAAAGVRDLFFAAIDAISEKIDKLAEKFSTIKSVVDWFKDDKKVDANDAETAQFMPGAAYATPQKDQQIKDRHAEAVKIRARNDVKDVVMETASEVAATMPTVTPLVTPETPAAPEPVTAEVTKAAPTTPKSQAQKAAKGQTTASAKAPAKGKAKATAPAEAPTEEEAEQEAIRAFETAQQGGQPAAIDYDALAKSMPPGETTVQAPVNQNFSVTVNGIPYNEMGDVVVKAIKERGQTDLAKFFADLITRAVAADRRASFAG